MSKLEELLKKHCPDGVEYVPLWSVTIWDKKFNSVDDKKQKNTFKYRYFTADELKELIVENGDVKILTTNISNLFTLEKLVSDSLNNGEIVCIPEGGNAIVQYYKGKFITGFNRIATSIDVNKLDNKFLYYVLINKLDLISSFYRGAGIKHPDMSKVLDIIIPLPPIEVQKEIVRILDTFTKYQDLLNRELELRKKQYEYYRDKLLTFDNNIEFKSLSECILNTNNIKWNINQDKKFKYIDLSSVSRENNQILECQVIDYETAPSRAQQIVIKDDVIFGTTRPMLKRMCIIPKTYDNQICSTGFCVLRANKQIVLPKWILYCISTKDFFIYVDKNQKGASYPAILDKEVKKYKIPVPPLEEQERIVKILDQFDTLCNDITRGLPAEIELRKKQYEYYRDKLLTFKEKK